jgi:aminopeptidase N
MSLVATAALVASLLPSTPAVSRAVTTAAPTAGSSGGGDPYFPLYGNGGYEVKHYGLDVRYDPKTDVLTGKASLTVRATKSLSRFNLDLVGLTVRSVRVDGRAARWVRRADHELVVTPARALKKGRSSSVVVRYDGKPRTFSDPMLGTYGFLKTRDGAIAVGQPEVAAYWYPVNDHPRDKATYTITLTVPRGLQSVSNGLPSKTRYSTRSGKRWATTTWTARHRMASYLAFMAVGHFTIHRYRTATGLPVIDAVDPSLSAGLRRQINASLARQKSIIAAESRWFGPYPFEAAGAVVDNVDVGFALENQTRSTYSPGFWDADGQPGDSDYVVAHEMAHQWYGDSVSVRRWSDIWLNEGFATYAEWLWLQETEKITPQDAVFDGAVYTRGGMTLQALRQAVGDAAFYQILQTWARTHRDGNGSTKQFMALAERISGRQLDALFTAWLFTPRKPALPAPPSGTPLQPLVRTPHQQAVRVGVAAWRADLDRRLALRSGH